MHRLANRYLDQVDFLYLNIDREETLPARQRFDIVARSQYVLIDADGNVISKWFGYIDETEIAEAIDALLASA